MNQWRIAQHDTSSREKRQDRVYPGVLVDVAFYPVFSDCASLVGGRYGSTGGPWRGAAAWKGRRYGLGERDHASAAANVIVNEACLVSKLYDILVLAYSVSIARKTFYTSCFEF